MKKITDRTNLGELNEILNNFETTSITLGLWKIEVVAGTLTISNNGIVRFEITSTGGVKVNGVAVH